MMNFKKINIMLFMFNVFNVNILMAKNVQTNIVNDIKTSNIEELDNIFIDQSEQKKCTMKLQLVDKVSTKKVSLDIKQDIVKTYKNLQIKLNKCYRNLNNVFAYIEIKEYIENDNKSINFEYNYSIDLNKKQKTKTIFSSWIVAQDMLFNNIKHKKYEFFIENIITEIEN